MLLVVLVVSSPLSALSTLLMLLSVLVSVLVRRQQRSNNLPFRTINFVVLVPSDYQAMLIDKVAALKHRKTNRFIIYFLIGREFGPLVLSKALGSLQQIFRKDRA
jgi:hypothetical protein